MVPEMHAVGWVHVGYISGSFEMFGIVSDQLRIVTS